MENTRDEKLQKLIAIKNLEKPAEFYFEGFVDSFHRHLDAQKAPQSWFNRLVETLDFSPQMQTVYATGLACVIAVGIFSTQYFAPADQSSTPSLLAANKSDYVDDQVMLLTAKPDDLRELILSSNTLADSDIIKTSYVLDATPVSYEYGLSF